MRIVEGLSVGVSAIRSNKLRSLLTMLGIIIGVASVLAMLAVKIVKIVPEWPAVVSMQWILISVSVSAIKGLPLQDNRRTPHELTTPVTTRKY